MNRPLILVLTFILILVFAAGCGKEPLRQTGLQGESTLNLVRDLNKAYENRSIEAFMELVSPQYPEREKFRKEVEAVFQGYQNIKQKVFYNRMQVTVEEKGNIRTAFTWEGEWRSQGGKVVKDGARSTLVIDKGVFKLLRVDGKNPYLVSEMPTRQQQ